MPSRTERLAAEAAIDYIEDGMLLGVGTGSTVNYFIDALPQVRNKIRSVVSSSEASSERLKALGFEVSELSETGDLDLYVDGADEANKHFHLIKGVEMGNTSNWAPSGTQRFVAPSWHESIIFECGTNFDTISYIL